MADAKLCGFPLCAPGGVRFLSLTVAAICSAVGFAALQEGVTQSPGFKFYGYMTLLTQATMCACGQLERMLTGERVRVGAIRDYLVLSLLTLSGALFTNWSLAYLNYPTRVLFKSSKLIPTMAVGTIMQGRRYSCLEYIAAVGLVAGLVLFTLGDADTSSSKKKEHILAGVLLILIGVVADAATSNYEEKKFFRVATPSSQPEVIVYANLFGSLWELLLLLINLAFAGDNELGHAIAHSMENPNVLFMLIASATCGYVSVSFVLLLINLYGATVTEMVKSMRKVLTVVLSFIIFPKAISDKYYLGGFFVLVSLAATHELQRRKGGDVHHHRPIASSTKGIAPVSNRMEEAPLAENASEGEAEAPSDAPPVAQQREQS
ncbi:hypothetical protein AB1Y20_001652 [Prymnesium parvum]|uniref:Sugar phosphate transporter domain-containing protein n=1 Tax=Prymnesium parvum TaxID=97485 RepID=A0AB34KBY9_PRYPA